ncbi:protein required for fusion of vesicles in vesicular transport, alpha-SNAP [Phyllosticta citriasiana]|uniref:Protein required for fusion of vesicles in vesicular transport, alpha-SNAP n=1 Tax=Phyllosticta citriasiana TaxID=595635 RepID=A0ABR1KNN1_9PEZI
MASADPRVLLQKADKAAASAGSGFSFFGGRSEKYENAVELYRDAANAFRIQKQGKEAGLAFERAADLQADPNKLNEPDDAANTRADAANAYWKSDPEDAARCMDQAIEHYVKKGNFRRAATAKQKLAELFEVEVGDQKKALEQYECAASWYEDDRAEALANKMWLKVADLAGLEGDYYKASDIYEKVARSSINNNLMRWSVKEYLFKAGICQLATNDLVGTNRAMERFREIDHTFPAQREHQLLVDLIQALEQSDESAFSDKLFQFDQLSTLDKWKTTLLLRVKNNIQEEEEDFS